MQMRRPCARRGGGRTAYRDSFQCIAHTSTTTSSCKQCRDLGERVELRRTLEQNRGRGRGGTKFISCPCVAGSDWLFRRIETGTKFGSLSLSLSLPRNPEHVSRALCFFFPVPEVLQVVA